MHDLTSPKFEEKICIEAHENEVLCLDFSKSINEVSLVESAVAEEDKAGHLLVSGSRDQLIQIYDSKKQYEPV